MGLFGSSKSAVAAQGAYSPDTLSGRDKLALFGAMLSDLGAGKGPQNILAMQQMLGQRQLLARKMAAEQSVQNLFAPKDDPTAPPVQEAMSIPSTGTGLPALNLPRIDAAPRAQMPSIGDAGTVRQLLAAKAAGADIGPALDVMRANQPHWAVGPDGRSYNSSGAESPGQFANPTAVNDTIVDLNDPSNRGKRVGVKLQNVNDTLVDVGDPTNANRQVPKVGEGQMLVQDMQGNFHVMDIPGYAEGQARKAGMVAGAEAKGRAPYEFFSAPTINGAPEVRAKSASAGGVFTGQSPTDAKRAEAATQAGIDLPRVTDQGQAALDLIDKITSHPGLDARTGMRSMIPAIPGTAGADFDALKAQLEGKVFLEAFTSLKGGGQITEVEGRKATDAIARLDKAQSKDAYLDAMNDLRSVIQSGLQRAQKAAGGQSVTATPPHADIVAEMKRRGLL